MTMFAPNFPLQEFLRVADSSPTRDQIEYAAQLSQLLQRIRDRAAQLTNDPRIVVTSWLRAKTSQTQHRDGSAVDFRPPAGITERVGVMLLGELQAQGAVWGEFIVYPYSDRHWHISLPTRTERCQMLVQLADGSYPQLTPQLLAQFPTQPRDTAPVSDVRQGSGAGALLLAGALLVATTRRA